MSNSATRTTVPQNYCCIYLSLQLYIFQKSRFAAKQTRQLILELLVGLNLGFTVSGNVQIRRTQHDDVRNAIAEMSYLKSI